jgi:hypothetical protein
LLAVTVILGGSLAPVQADAPLVYCRCSQGDYFGPGRYAYDVDSASYPMVEFVVGTNDLESGNYLNVCIPPGWSFAVEPVWMHHAHDYFTYHGSLSPGPCWCLTLGRVRWWTDDPNLAVESFTFGFEHPWRGHDVEWVLTTRRPGPPPEYNVFEVDWESPVGMGTGAVHGPCEWPELCWDPGDCSEDAYCFRSHCSAESGACLTRPQECPEYDQPVCGCDGSTYENPCLAARAGISLAYAGACITGDLDLDGDVDLHDLAGLLAGYGACVGEPGYWELADLDSSGCIDLADLAALLATYGN